VPVARRELLGHRHLDLLALRRLQEDLLERFEFPDRPPDIGSVGGRRHDPELHRFRSRHGAGVGDRERDGDHFVVLQTGHLGRRRYRQSSPGEGGVRQTVPEREPRNGLVPLVGPVSHEDIFAVENAATLGAEIQEGRAVLQTNGNRQG
jgi:hypothetical protein